MKKQVIAALVLVAAAIGATTPSWAFTSVQRSTFTAGLTTGGTATAQASVHLRLNTNPFGADVSSITWSGVAIPGTAWKIGDDFLLINATVTDSGGGVQIYTDNTNTTSGLPGPFFQDPTPGAPSPGSLAEGLVSGAANTTTSAPPLQLAWSIKGSSQIINTDIGASDPNSGPTSGIASRFQWLFMNDRYNTFAIPAIPAFIPFSDGVQGSKMINVTGQQASQASFNTFPDGVNSFVYLEANFSGAATQTQYQTGALIVEVFKS